MLTAEELLAGSSLTFEVELPGRVLQPENGGEGVAITDRAVRLRPLTVADLQLVSRAAKESDSLLGSLMVQRALVEPELSVAEVAALHVGLVQYLLGEVNRISGIDASSDAFAELRNAPLAKAAYVLAREFGWTPEEIGELTLGQVLLHLQMLDEQ
jgi:hypothetical protein